MTHITADALDQGQGQSPHALARDPRLSEDNITLAADAGKKASTGLLGIGAAALAIVLMGGFVFSGKHALASYHFAVMAAMGVAIGGLFWTLVTHLTNAGWSITLRRQMENLAAMIPIALALLIPTLIVSFIKPGILWTWMSPIFEGDYLLKKKDGYLNIVFFLVRLGIYAAVWSYLVQRMRGYSLKQDENGDRWLTAKAAKTSAWGILAFGLTVAFASFDLLKSIDFRFFSTMWGVYFFAGSAYASIATLILVMAVLTSRGKLRGVVTEEHFHDMGKLLFSFTVFWSYIAFCQYFLIWYSNIPEETAYYLARKTGAWKVVFYLLCFGHFLAPFVILLFRNVKRKPKLLSAMAIWALVIHFIDLFFVVRPMVYAQTEGPDKMGMSGLWIDVAAVIGVSAIFAALLIRRVASGNLIPTRDPRLGEALAHKNYV